MEAALEAWLDGVHFRRLIFRQFCPLFEPIFTMADQEFDGNGDFQGDMGGDFNQEAEDALLNGAENGNGDQAQQSSDSAAGRDDDR